MAFKQVSTFRGLVLFLALAASMVTTWGCNSDQKRTYPVKGQFVWPDGTPAKELLDAMVIFQCDEEEISAKASVDEEGRFVLGTYTMDDGAIAGKHKVAIAQPSHDASDYKPLQVVDPKYESPETTDLEVTVEAKPNEIVLKVSPGAWMKRRKQ